MSLYTSTTSIATTEHHLGHDRKFLLKFNEIESNFFLNIVVVVVVVSSFVIFFYSCFFFPFLKIHSSFVSTMNISA